MDLPFKILNNYVSTLAKTSKNTGFHSVIDALSSSKYKTLLTCNETIYVDTQRELWKNAKLETKDKKTLAITSSIRGIPVVITPQTISEVFEINDLTGVQYPLDLPAVREEIKSFYSEDDPEKRKLPSVQGYPLPRNIEEYLKIKAQQADDISKRGKV
ncbi:hypothetical protein Hdeb2414_s0015g00437321 [Helianthus debilis subsp. tardiflorus]